jgi:hypothetical protein
MPVHRWDLGVAEGGPREGVHVRSEEHAEKFREKLGAVYTAQGWAGLGNA